MARGYGPRAGTRPPHRSVGAHRGGDVGTRVWYQPNGRNRRGPRLQWLRCDLPWEHWQRICTGKQAVSTRRADVASMADLSPSMMMPLHTLAVCRLSAVSITTTSRWIGLVSSRGVGWLLMPDLDSPGVQETEGRGQRSAGRTWLRELELWDDWMRQYCHFECGGLYVMHLFRRGAHGQAIQHARQAMDHAESKSNQDCFSVV